MKKTWYFEGKEVIISKVNKNSAWVTNKDGSYIRMSKDKVTKFYSAVVPRSELYTIDEKNNKVCGY